MTVGQTGMTWILSSRNDVLATSFSKRRKTADARVHYGYRALRPGATRAGHRESQRHQPFGGIVNEANAR